MQLDGRYARITLEKAGSLELIVIRPDGRVVKKLKKSASAGNVSMIWDDGTLAAGIYSITIKSAGKSVTSKGISIK
jgi:hypothetical protein